MFIEEIIGAFTGQNRRNRQKSAFWGATLGLLTGASLALLFAPQSGKETREDIHNAAVRGKDMALDYGRQGYEALCDAYGKASEAAVGFAGEMYQSADRARREVARHARRLARGVVADTADLTCDLADKVAAQMDEACACLEDIECELHESAREASEAAHA